ncbi:MAG TPA: ribonuclease HII [Thermoplasmata archaeon]|jgi:ribonuclease HII|nr:ribonuclease HII [Thermoplasmata archaeon]
MAHRRPPAAIPAPCGTILGLDEAGRGSLVGPLVVGGFLMDAARVPDLGALGVRDSKRLTPARREAIFAELPGIGRPLTVVLAPRAVDRAVADGLLNELELEAFARLIREHRPDIAYADACDPVAERFGRRLRSASGHSGRVHACHKADRDLLVVGAASIVAKVHRDRAMARLRHRLGDDLGSGYPSDEGTIDFVRAALADGAPPPSWLRASWATMERVIPSRPARPLEAFGP